MKPSHSSALKTIEKLGGVVRTSEALERGIHPRTLYELRDEGLLVTLARGLYKLASSAPLSNPDLVTVVRSVPKGIVCLISALDYHGLTTQIPHTVSMALPRGTRVPVLDYPPLTIYYFSKSSLETGVQLEKIDAQEVPIFNPAKTIADCFKFRQKIGMDVVLEALKLYKQRYGSNFNELMAYARVCRIHKIITPYLEASL